MKYLENQYDAIVIGSGMGGLTAAALLAKTHNKRVLLLEKHWVAGGLTHTFKRPGGYEWDVGLHYVGALRKKDLPRKLFDFISEGRLQWQPMPDEFERFVYPDLKFSVPSDPKRYQCALIKQFPQEKAAIKKYFKHIAAVNHWSTRHFLQSVTPAWLRYPLQLSNVLTKKLALKTTQAYLDEHFENQKLKALLASQWGDYGLRPEQSAFAIHAMIVAHYWYGAWFPEGGAGQIAASILPTIEAKGGRCLTHTEVTEVLVENHRAIGVKTQNKQGIQEYYAPLIISNIGAYETYTRFLTGHAHQQHQQIRESLHQRQSAVTLYIGFKQNPNTLNFKGENHWIYNSFEHKDDSQSLLNGKANGCYLSFPSLKQAFAKKHTAEIIAFVPYTAFQAWQTQPYKQRDQKYIELKQKITKALLDLVEQHYPGFKHLIDYTELSTPLSIEHFTSRKNGSMYGVPATPERYKADWLSAQTPLKGLYLSGSDVCSLGIVGAMMGGMGSVIAAGHAFSLPLLMRQLNKTG